MTTLKDTTGINENRDKVIGFIVAMHILLMSVKNVLIQGSPYLLSLNSALNSIFFILIGVTYLMGLRYVFSGAKAQSFFIVFISFIIIMFNMLIFPQNVPFIIGLLPRTLLYSFIGFIFLSAINNYKYFLTRMTKYSYIVIFASIISAYLLVKNSRIEFIDSQYSMSLSYFTSIPTMFLLKDYFSKKNFKALVFSILGISIILLFGSRSYILPVVVYIFISLLRRVKTDLKSPSKLTFKIALFILLIYLLFEYRGDIARKLYFTLSDYGINSRTLELFINDDILNLSGRDEIYSVVVHEFLKNPFLGIGVGGSDYLTGTGVHNMYLEIFVSLGLIVGTLVFIAILYVFIGGLIKSKDYYSHELIIIYACVVFPRGFIGGGLWTNHDLWRLLAICISVSINYRSKLTLNDS